MHTNDLTLYPHRRKNVLTGEWVLVSPHRAKRPWQGEISSPGKDVLPAYEPGCYLCPGNKRANGERNPHFRSTYVFTNDFSALLDGPPATKENRSDLLISRPEVGTCRVVNFSPKHNVTLAEMTEHEIEDVISAWQDEFSKLGSDPRINYVQIFENKGSIMGNSNPHPHGQIWAQENIPMEPLKELKQQKLYFTRRNRSLLSDYLKLELRLKERIVYENDLFAVVVPYWAVWPYETIIISKRKFANILKFTEAETKAFANVLSVTTIKYDNLFDTSFPYSAGLHQAPTDGKEHKAWHFHMHFYPPLLRSARIKKYMVGYELLAEPQRDLTPECSANVLRELPVVHFRAAQRERLEGKPSDIASMSR